MYAFLCRDEAPRTVGSRSVDHIGAWHLTRIGWTTLIYSEQRTPPGSHVILPMWMTAFGVIAVAVAASVLALLLEIRHRRTHAVPRSGG